MTYKLKKALVLNWKILTKKLEYNWRASFKPSKHFNVGSTLLLGWYDVATSHNVKSTLKQRCVRQRWNLQRWNNVVYFNVELNNVRQRRNNVVIFNVDFHNLGQRRNNWNMAIWKKIKPRFKSKITFLSFKEYAGLKIFFSFPSC